jgi:hypothetical protein
MTTPAFPGAIKTWTDKSDHTDDVMAEHTNDLYAEVIAIETYLKENIAVNGILARQAIINGNFDICQRGTSFTNPTTGTYGLDRWKFSLNVDGGSFPSNIIHSQQVLTQGDIFNSYYFYRINVDGAGSSYGANAQYATFQFIEHGTRLLCGLNKKVTVSFYARSSISNKKIGIYLIQNYGTGGTPTAQETINGTKFTLTSSWTKYTFTFTTNTLVGKTFGTANNDAVALLFQSMWGSNIAARVGDSVVESFVGAGDIDIAQVQLCAGDVALPYSPKSYEQELHDCMKYCYKIGDPSSGSIYTGLLQNFTTTIMVFELFIPVSMRIPPTVTMVGARGTAWYLYNNNSANATGTMDLTGQTSKDKILVAFTAGTYTVEHALNALKFLSGGYLLLDAEL